MCQFPELEYSFEYSAVDIGDNIRIAYTDRGNRSAKDVLIFIHGLSSYIPAWSKLIPRLEEKFRCIAIDLPGYAKSSSGVYSGSMAFYAGVISKFAEKLNLNSVSLAGHSMGGQIAITAALLYPHLINRLVLLAPAGLEVFTEKEIARLMKNNKARYYASATDKQIEFNYRINFYEMNKDVEFMIEDRKKMRGWKNFNDYCEVVASSMKGMLEYPVHGMLSLIKQKTIIIFGLNDQFIPQPVLHNKMTVKEIAEQGAGLIPHCRLVLIDKCGHFVQYEKDEETAVEIIKFFEEK